MLYFTGYDVLNTFDRVFEMFHDLRDFVRGESHESTSSISEGVVKAAGTEDKYFYLVKKINREWPITKKKSMTTLQGNMY